MALVKYNNNSLSAITATAGMPAGAMTLIKEQTASASGTISFVNGTSDVVISSTYPIYLFKFINVHPATDNAEFQFNVSIDTGSNYNVAKTTTNFQTYHNEGGTDAGISYETGSDLAQGTAAQILQQNVGNDNDQCCSGELWLFNPSSTTFVKHFLASSSRIDGSNYNCGQYVAGYANTTSAVDAVQFSMNSGNLDSGTFKLYGIKDS